eukprot:107532_1
MSRRLRKQPGKSPLVAINIDQAYSLYIKMHDKAPTASRFKRFINNDKRCQMAEIDFVTADRYLTTTGKGRTSASPSGTTYSHIARKKKKKRRKHVRNRATSMSTNTNAVSPKKKKNKRSRHTRSEDFQLSGFDFTKQSNKSRPEVQLASLAEFTSLKTNKTFKQIKKRKKRTKKEKANKSRHVLPKIKDGDTTEAVPMPPDTVLSEIMADVLVVSPVHSPRRSSPKNVKKLKKKVKRQYRRKGVNRVIAKNDYTPGHVKAITDVRHEITHHSIGCQTENVIVSKTCQSIGCQTESNTNIEDLLLTIQDLKQQLTEKERIISLKSSDCNWQTIANKNSIIQAQFHKINDLEQQLKHHKITSSKKANIPSKPLPQFANGKKKTKPFKFLSNTESRPDILVYGYMRMVEDEFHDLNIPNDITNLCYLFYYQDMNLILISGSKQSRNKQWNEMQYIKLYHIEKEYKKYFINIQSAKDNKDATMNDLFDRYSYGQCVSSHISLPTWNVLNKYPQIHEDNSKIGKYQCVMRCGGQYSLNDTIIDRCDMILFDADSKTTDDWDGNVMNGYHIELPSLPAPVKSASVLYDDSTSTLYCVGGQATDSTATAQVYNLKLNTIEVSKWKPMRDLKEGRYASSLCMITDYQRIAVIGGRGNRMASRRRSGLSFYKSSVEVVPTENMNVEMKCNIECCDMRNGRVACGSVYNNVTGNTIIVGGGLGYGASNSVEYFDLNHNKWIALKYETNHPHHTPFITYDIYNPNIIYIGSNSVGNHLYSMLGFIEWIDIRDSSCKCWNFLVDKPMQNVFDLETDIPLAQRGSWRSRSLMLS